MVKFSIIVPVYNVEKYLEECVDSILKQSFSDFEIILVDDCSPDKSPEICDELALKDNRIKVVHKPQNEGLGFARNTGMTVASGEYIVFVDSDDTIAENTLEECAAKLSDKPDIIVFGMKLCYENDKGKVVRSEELVPENFIANNQQEIAEMFRRLSAARVFQYACNKAYNREFLLACATQFEKTKLIEDFLFNIDVFSKAKRVESINKYFYFYRKPTHITLANSYNPEFFELFKRKFKLEQEFLKSHNCYDGECLQQILKGYIKHIISAVIRNRSKSAALSYKAQKEKVLYMIDDDLTKEVLKSFKPNGMVFKVIVNLIENRRANSLLFLSSIIDFAQTRFLSLIKK